MAFEQPRMVEQHYNMENATKSLQLGHKERGRNNQQQNTSDNKSQQGGWNMPAPAAC